jgi:Zn-finger nucleic acid-binding protein
MNAEENNDENNGNCCQNESGRESEGHTASSAAALGTTSTTTMNRSARSYQQNNNLSQQQQRPLNISAGQISTRVFNFGIPTNQGTQEHAYAEHGESSWRYKVLKFLHSRKVQSILMGLLLLDILVLFAEILILASYPHCSIIRRDAISCCPTANDDGAAERRRRQLSLVGVPRFVSENQEHEHSEEICEDPGFTTHLDFPAGCDEHKWKTVHTIETVLFALTISILSLFFLELTVSMIALKPQIFFRQFFFALDFFIITVSLFLELFFHFLEDDLYQSLAGLLVMIRIWRFVRIGHGIVEVTNEYAHKEYTGLWLYTEELEKILQDKNIPLPETSVALHKHHDHHTEDSLLDRIEAEELAKKRRKLGNNHHDLALSTVPEH